MMAPPASFLTKTNIYSQILAKMMEKKKKTVKWPPMRAVAIAITSEIRNLTVKRPKPLRSDEWGPLLLCRIVAPIICKSQPPCCP